MGWNIEIATIRIPQTTPLHELVPDVFEPTDEQVGWEDATSVMRDTDLCASWLKGWGIVLDVNCRLSAFEPFLKETSVNADMFVFRVANQPVEVHYKKGRKVWKHNSLESVLRSLRKKIREWIQVRTGLDFTEDFWSVQYSVFKLPDIRGLT